MNVSIQKAITAHQEGRLDEAEQLYRSILENQPTNLDVHNILGVIRRVVRFKYSKAKY